MSGILTLGLNHGLGASNILTLGLGPRPISAVNPLITNISPEYGAVAALGASSRFSLRDALTEINLSKLQLYHGTGPVFYRGGTLPEKLVGPPTFYFQAQSGSPGVYADREILPDDYLRISKSVPSQNQEAVYFMGGLEAPAEPDAPLMLEFNLRLNKTEVTLDGAGFTGVLVGLLNGNSGLTVKFFNTGGLPKIEIHDAALTTSSPPNTDYISYFNWDEALALNTDGSNTYKLVWHPQIDLVRLYVRDHVSVTDRLLIDGAVSDFPTVPVQERRVDQPWLFFGHGAYPLQTSISEWKDVYLYNIVGAPVRTGIISGEYITELTTNNPTYYDGKALPRDCHGAWQRLPDSFGTFGGGERVTQDGLVLERTSSLKSIGFYRVEPKVTRKTVLDIRLAGRVLTQEPTVETTGIEFYADDGVRQARVALLQDIDGTQYVGILKTGLNPAFLSSYERVVQGFEVERSYRLVFTPGVKAELIMLAASDEGVEELPIVTLVYSQLPITSMPGPGIGFLHNANSGGATAQMTVRQVRYTTDTEVASWVDFNAAAWTKIGTGTFTPTAEPGEVTPSFGRLVDASSSDNTYFKKEYNGAVLQADNGWSLEFRSRVVSYYHDPALTKYLPASGLDPIRASTGFMVHVLDGGNRAALVFAEAGPPIGKIVFLALDNDTHENLLSIRAKSSSVVGTYYTIDWTKFHLFRLEKTVGGDLRLYVDEGLEPVLKFSNREFAYPPHTGGGNPRVEIGHAETGIKTTSDFQLIKFGISDGFDVSCKPALTEEELLQRFSHATNILVETEDV